MSLEELTSNAKQIQDDLLDEILRTNANTEYLRRFLHGNSNKELFKKHVPLVSYENVKPYIDRVANGEPSSIISGKPITSFCLSSGTSGGKQIKDLSYKLQILQECEITPCSSIISKHINVEEGKVMMLLNTSPVSTTPSGLHVAPIIATSLRSDFFKNRPNKNNTSPDEVILCDDKKQSMYCHLLCALVQREEVVSIYTSFAYVLVQAIRFLETYWKELCANIRFGYISEWITDLSCRDSVSVILGEANLELADLIEQECSQQLWEGIITRLWPNIKFIRCTLTGQMSQYIPILEFYSKKLPLISSIYASSETLFGINVNPLCKPQDVSYTFMPNMSYFEFIHVDDEGNNDGIVDLVDVKLGCFYEPLVTNHFGLYRYKMGDVLQVTGFYNKAPQFRFVRRKNVVLSIQVEATSEEDILKAMKTIGWGTNEKLIISILAHRNSAQRSLIRSVYAATYNEDLLKSLEKELSDDAKYSIWDAFNDVKATNKEATLKFWREGIDVNQKDVSDVIRYLRAHDELFVDVFSLKSGET